MASCRECIPDNELPEWAQPKTEQEKKQQAQLSSSGKIFSAAKSGVFIIGSCIILIASLRNSLTWHFEHVWGASKNFWELLWGGVLDAFSHNHFLISTVGTTIVTTLVFWFVASFFLFLDLTGKPDFLTQYKIQEGKKIPIDRKKFWKAVRVCLFNQLVLGGSFTFLLSSCLQSRLSYAVKELPTFHWVLVELMVFILVEEIMFYYFHRLFHHPRLYKYIHKKHHEWTAPICIIAIYAHPVEHILSNLLPIVAGPLLMGSHCATGWLWFTIAYVSTLISHSGYHLPLLPSPEAHDYHHFKFINNFGVLGILDRLHGTDSMFRKTRCFDRHIMLMGLIPLKETFPDDNKCSSPDKKCC